MVNKVLGQQLIKIARQEGKFLLKSGVTSNVYWDKFKFESDPKILAKIAAELAKLLSRRAQVLGGMELGGIPLVTALSAKTGLPATYIRKETKKYGTTKKFEGAVIKDKRTILVEDIVTSGGSVKDGIIALREAGAVVDKVVCVILRSEQTRVVVQSLGIKLEYLFTMAELDSLL